MLSKRRETAAKLALQIRVDHNATLTQAAEDKAQAETLLKLAAWTLHELLEMLTPAKRDTLLPVLQSGFGSLEKQLTKINQYVAPTRPKLPRDPPQAREFLPARGQRRSRWNAK